MTLRFEGRDVEVREGDSVASALYRAGVRTFSRSFKYHRRRGLYCLSGDCAGCLLEVDGEPDVRSCQCRARDGMRVRRQSAWPNAERDLLAVNDRMHWAFPAGFYYKTLIRPAFAWRLAEPVIRRVAGRGRIDLSDVPRDLERAYRHPDVLVVGLGPAGLSAALGAAGEGARVLAVDERRPGERLPPGPARDAVERLLAEARANPAIELLEDHTAVGVYGGPEVPVIGPELLLMVQPRAIVAATGAFESNVVFPGNDLPGVFLGRGAVRLAAVHGVRVGERAVILRGTHEAADHAVQLERSGTRVVAVVDAVQQAHGRKRLEAVTTPDGTRIEADVLLLSASFTPQDGILRHGPDDPVYAAGDVFAPGPVEPTIEQARAAGVAAARGDARVPVPAPQPPPPCGADGYVCPCYDVTVGEIERSVEEGFRSTELLKRYTTATMGACQGRLCHAQLRELAGRLTPGGDPVLAGPTTARPPLRPLRLEEAVAGARHHVERRTGLHDLHRARGASFLWAGEWKRVEAYGPGLSAIQQEYRAVREGVGLIDVGTLGKFLVAGPDAVPFLEALYPNRVGDLQPGRLRYGLLLDEGGVILDDGTICRLAEDRFYLTVTTSGAEEAEARFLDWRDTLGHRVHLVNQTAALGALNVAGPAARTVLQELTADDVSREGFPYLRHRRITVAGIPCLAIRLGFVGEVGWELHHPASRSGELWHALLEAGAPHGIRPFGIQAQRLLRLEKGHIIVSQDTDFETTPWHLGMEWAVKLDKGEFVGRAGLVRKRGRPTERLVGFRLDAGAQAPYEGAAVKVGGQLAGRVTSSWHSPALGHGIGLCWVPPDRAEAGQRLTIGPADAPASVVHGAFYDPEGARLRA